MRVCALSVHASTHAHAYTRIRVSTFSRGLTASENLLFHDSPLKQSKLTTVALQSRVLRTYAFINP